MAKVLLKTDQYNGRYVAMGGQKSGQIYFLSVRQCPHRAPSLVQDDLFPLSHG